jgi:UDP-N-acetylglucosamine 2-epimerase (hydrolysing)
MENKKILFITGTRADFGKIKSLIKVINSEKKFETFIFVTGMHMLNKYGYTFNEVIKSGFKNTYLFVNQNIEDNMDQILAKTINGLSDYIKELKPNMIIIHGDRVETLAGAIVGSFNNILTAHIEGGEISGTIDESIRHAVTKLSHIHFCNNIRAKKRLVQLGESKKTIFAIGSPDFDILKSNNLPALNIIKKYYEIKFKKYAILIIHPVTTNVNYLEKELDLLINCIKKSKLNYVIIYPNNDYGSSIIIDKYIELEDNADFKILRSMRFEYFLGLLKHAEFLIGNSSTGILEAPYLKVPSINIGNRQKNRSVKNKYIFNVQFDEEMIMSSINKSMHIKNKRPNLIRKSNKTVHEYSVASKFLNIITNEFIWKISPQKYFIDI